MTRKDYVIIAGALRRALLESGPGACADGVVLAAENVADVLAADNPRFDRDKFLGEVHR